MERDILLETHYGKEVWTHHQMDELRKTECLCRLCKEKEHGFCKDANALYAICQSSGIALSVTRCANFELDTGA